MKKLLPEETILVGKWQFDGKKINADEVCDRIKWLTENNLEKIAISKEYGAWETLFRDAEDGRYWEKTYPQGEMQGGGPPTLTCISEEIASEKYDL